MIMVTSEPPEAGLGTKHLEGIPSLEGAEYTFNKTPALVCPVVWFNPLGWR